MPQNIHISYQLVYGKGLIYAFENCQILLKKVDCHFEYLQDIRVITGD